MRVDLRSREGCVHYGRTAIFRVTTLRLNEKWLKRECLIFSLGKFKLQNLLLGIVRKRGLEF